MFAERRKSSIQKSATASKNKTGRTCWQKDEDERLVEALKVFGKDWTKVVEHVGTRSHNAVKHRSVILEKKASEQGIDLLPRELSYTEAKVQNFAIYPTKKVNTWQKDEKERLLRAVTENGS